MERSGRAGCIGNHAHSKRCISTCTDSMRALLRVLVPLGSEKPAPDHEHIEKESWNRLPGLGSVGLCEYQPRPMIDSPAAWPGFERLCEAGALDLGPWGPPGGWILRLADSDMSDMGGGGGSRPWCRVCAIPLWIVDASSTGPYGPLGGAGQADPQEGTGGHGTGPRDGTGPAAWCLCGGPCGHRVTPIRPDGAGSSGPRDRPRLG